ncbi:GNAT family N-acetyltransferase [Mitsuaria sp. WAJ17]|uniref:GNAT family N-acetyltransferase n=1 Tax=Mitsuaria sp. WAJ17 TaxID=2761452 RepID=UPI00160118FE|nr:GNAT family N-acetyltransferase [Mitsuaria sp. WAJ17]MBB2483707.1 GNAT family N-acetyltransferase [Mitsuaria sp. WAJ17]
MCSSPASTAAPRLIPARLDQHAAELLALNTEYMSWVFTGIEQHFGALPAALSERPVADYAAEMLDKVCGDLPPAGCFYLLTVPDGSGHALRMAGMGGLRRLDEQRAELKRIYLRPGLRGLGLGTLLMQRLVEDARAFGYRQLCLDSAPFMQEAQALYARQGFQDCAPHAGTEVPAPLQSGWRFMQRPL